MPIICNECGRLLTPTRFNHREECETGQREEAELRDYLATIMEDDEKAEEVESEIEPNDP